MRYMVGVVGANDNRPGLLVQLNIFAPSYGGAAG